METKSNDQIAKRYGIPKEDILWYNAGICYDRIILSTFASADKVSKALEGQFVNGGMFDGMPLGSITERTEADNKKVYEIMC